VDFGLHGVITWAFRYEGVIKGVGSIHGGRTFTELMRCLSQGLEVPPGSSNCFMLVPAVCYAIRRSSFLSIMDNEALLARGSPQGCGKSN